MSGRTSGSNEELGVDQAQTRGVELDELRDVLVGPERARIEALERKRLDTAELARALPAMVRTSAKSGDELGRALSPMMETALQESVRRDPKTLADAIFPILGPAIRKSIAASLAAMLESFNRTLEHSFSPRSWAWRFEAWRTQTSFAEIVLMRTLAYRVEQVFLIHAQTGLVLQHLVAPTVATSDPDMVAGMLTAIGDFTAQSFSPEGGEPLQQIEFGEHVIEIRRGPHAVLAAVVRGFAPVAWRAELQERLEDLHRHFATELSNFGGNTDAFEAARPMLEPLLAEQRVAKRSSTAALATLSVVALVVVAWIVRATIMHLDASGFRSDVERVLRSERGWVLVELEDVDGGLRALVLRAQDSRTPQEVLRSAAIDPAKLVIDAHGILFAPGDVAR